MSKYEGHTPGPWEVEYGQLHPASEKKGYTIRTNAYDVVSGHLAIRREEDARLMVAAPDLLAERDKLREVVKNLLSMTVILSDDYLSAFENVPMDHLIQGWDKARWIRVSQAAKQARAALQEAEG